MKKGYLLLMLVSILCVHDTFSQRGLAWKRTRYEVIGGLGAGLFMGDLGGGSNPGSTFDKYIGDMDVSTTRPSMMLGMRYKLSPSFALKLNLAMGWIEGSDANSGEPGRMNRNLSFSSYIFEQSMYCEYSIIKESNTRRWSKRRKKKVRGFSTNLYTFVGVGGFAFNPTTEYNGKTYNLWEIGTEGQNIQGAEKQPYSRYSICFPYGIGLKIGINRKMDIGVEYGFRYTLTDYVDDTGGNYGSHEAILANEKSNGTTGSELRAIGFIVDNHVNGATFTQVDFDAMKENGGHIYEEVYQVGDRKPFGEGKYDTGTAGVKSGPANDIYMFLFINFSYKLNTGRNGLPKFK